MHNGATLDLHRWQLAGHFRRYAQLPCYGGPREDRAAGKNGPNPTRIEGFRPYFEVKREPTLGAETRRNDMPVNVVVPCVGDAGENGQASGLFPPN